MSSMHKSYSGRLAVAWAIKTIPLFILCSWVLSAHASELKGKVLGKDNLPKKFVSVSVFGSVNRRTQTNSEGVFLVDLPPGSFTIRIRQDPRRKEFIYEMPGKDSSFVFELDW